MTGRKFPELEQLERIIDRLGDKAHTQIIERIDHKKHMVYCITDLYGVACLAKAQG